MCPEAPRLVGVIDTRALVLCLLDELTYHAPRGRSPPGCCWPWGGWRAQCRRCPKTASVLPAWHGLRLMRMAGKRHTGGHRVAPSALGTCGYFRFGHV
jgi:hypothetical protein